MDKQRYLLEAILILILVEIFVLLLNKKTQDMFILVLPLIREILTLFLNKKMEHEN